MRMMRPKMAARDFSTDKNYPQAQSGRTNFVPGTFMMEAQSGRTNFGPAIFMMEAQSGRTNCTRYIYDGSPEWQNELAQSKQAPPSSLPVPTNGADACTAT